MSNMPLGSWFFEEHSRLKKKYGKDFPTMQRIEEVIVSQNLLDYLRERVHHCWRDVIGRIDGALTQEGDDYWYSVGLKQKVKDSKLIAPAGSVFNEEGIHKTGNDWKVKYATLTPKGRERLFSMLAQDLGYIIYDDNVKKRKIK